MSVFRAMKQLPTQCVKSTRTYLRLSRSLLYRNSAVFAQYVANGQVRHQYVTVESEHSSMSTCIGAEAAGCRAVTATSSCGLAFMYELLYVASSSRLPITLACVNRALTGPININNDHSDSAGRARCRFWIQLRREY